MSSISPSSTRSNAAVVTLTNIDGFASSRKPQGAVQAKDATHGGSQRRNGGEVVPDSEEDRDSGNLFEHKEVIVISSDSEGEGNEVKNILGKSGISLPGGWPSDSQDEDEEERAVAKLLFKPTRPRQRFPPARRIIESSGSEESGQETLIRPVTRRPEKKLLRQEVIELTSSSEFEEEQSPIKQMRVDHREESSSKLPSYLIEEDGGAVLVFDEPKTARKPIRVTVPSQRIPTKQTWEIEAPSIQDASEQPATDCPPSLTHCIVSTPGNRSPSRPKAARSAPRMSKKAIEAAKQTERERYAQNLFTELNRAVFKNGLPMETKLNWSKRLLTTAGRARYYRSRDGVERSEIELATKILDCEERIRNTLSHEMCHLATWVIDKKLNENHGKLFKYWAAQVVKKRPDIEITTRHDYEISYPFKWECEKCQKVYGRHSKSIRPDECVCGACKEGRLIPLFSVPEKANTPKVSRMAAGKSQDSPRLLSQPPKPPVNVCGTGDDSDLDIETIIQTMCGTHIV